MKKIILIVLDGWGFSEESEGNAILQANTPQMDRFMSEYPWALLDAAGEAVGLPDGQMGNSEVGHLNLGAGRIVYQELTRISRCINSGDFFNNPVLIEAMQSAKNNESSLHLIGLVSDGGVHSHFDHLLALLEMAGRQKLQKVFVHAILDGRDTIPFGAKPFLEQLDKLGKEKGYGQIATVTGRYYAMDRDNRWDRIEKAYRAYVRGEGISYYDPIEALEQAYERGEGDEFVQPSVILDSSGRPRTLIHSEDSVIFFNFRPDRARQLSRTLIEADFSHFNRGDNFPLPFFATMTEYNKQYNVPAAFITEDLRSTLGEVYASRNLAQMRIAETEKYAHVTFFFSGGREYPFPGEDRILVPSPGVATYDLMPEMSAPEVTSRIVETIKESKHPLIVANFANADMVGHSGKFNAAIKAVEAVDTGLGAVAAAGLPRGWNILICGDHGNAEQMRDKAGETLTAHSANPVPFLMLSPEEHKLRDRGILADVAPTILELADLDVPSEMSGKSMLKKE
ncbi:MAG: 2,3-bisphosphoglycerate-independent phosphoglycerate mutase [Bacillota bacterium]|nr:2,3-bisphosphoglycerate-independent phosphoglycerate mutase [Bacillota bacterium]